MEALKMKDERPFLYALNREKLLIDMFFSPRLHLLRFLYKVFVVDCVIIERIERKAGEKEE
jgi:hypothetical protein